MMSVYYNTYVGVENSKRELAKLAPLLLHYD